MACMAKLNVMNSHTGRRPAWEGGREGRRERGRGWGEQVGEKP